jgi:hypothetical protein
MGRDAGARTHAFVVENQLRGAIVAVRLNRLGGLHDVGEVLRAELVPSSVAAYDQPLLPLRLHNAPLKSVLCDRDPRVLLLTLPEIPREMNASSNQAGMR